jgi:hypothetical protein
MVDSSFLETVQISNINMSSRYTVYGAYTWFSLGYVLSSTGIWRPWRTGRHLET